MEKKTMFTVIKDAAGNYVSGNRTFTTTGREWLYCCYTGKTTGFTFYSNRETLISKLKKLQELNDNYDFGKEFHTEYIDIKKIPQGKRNIEKLKNNKEINFCAK